MVNNILTTAEAAAVLRVDEDDPMMLDLLPAVDAYIRNATGRDWSQDSPIHASAKQAARVLLVRMHEDPGMMAAGGALSLGLGAALAQLEALGGRYFSFQGGSGAGSISLEGARAGDTVTSLVGKIGLTGDQHALFESVITVDDEIQQSSTSDLSGKWFLALLTPVGDL